MIGGVFKVLEKLAPVVLAAAFLAAPAQAVRLVDGEEVTFGWDAATGPVEHYGVYISRDGGPFPAQPNHVTEVNELTIASQPSTVISVRVAAFDARGNRGPFSSVSERIVFLGRAVELPPPPPGVGTLPRYDFDGDGHTDLLWRDPANGMVSAWLMGPDGPWRQRDISQLPSHWELLTSEDLDGDGSSDLVWHDPRSGNLHAWELDGTTLVGEVDLPAGPGPLVYAGDLEGDGRSDLVFRSDAGLTAWSMRVDVLRHEWTLPEPPSGQRIACRGDFDGDGDPDLLWQPHVPGPPSIWRLERGSFIESLSLGAFVGGGWGARCGDVDGDGHADVVWSNPANGAAHVWRVQDAALVATAEVLAPGSGWRVAATGDFDGDGLLEELLLHGPTDEQRIRELSWTPADGLSGSDRLLADLGPDAGALLSP